MRTRLKKILVGVSALAALALGGAAISQAGSSTPPQKSPEPAASQEQTAPENSATDPDNVQDECTKDDATEKGGTAEEREPAGARSRTTTVPAATRTSPLIPTPPHVARAGSRL
jgi:hypothetical protein